MSDSLQTIGTAYRNLMVENPYLQEKRFEKIFYYQVGETVKENGRTVI